MKQLATYPLLDKMLSVDDAFAREKWEGYIPTLLGLVIVAQRDGRRIFREEVVQVYVLLPSVLWIVDLVVGRRLGEV